MKYGAAPLAVAAIFAVGLTSACTRDNRTAADRAADNAAITASPSPTATPYASDRDTITAGEVAANPTKYVGQRVAVTGDVADFVNNNAFTLDEDRLTADQNLLVISRSGVPSREHKDSKVTVSGRVQMFTQTEIERDHDWFKATPDIETKYRNRPVLIADSVRTADGRDLLSSALPAGPGELSDRDHDRDRAGHGNRPADRP